MHSLGSLSFGSSYDPPLDRLFPGDSEMASRMRDFDWASTEFGPVEGWPENLRVPVKLALTSRFPILLWWGPMFAILYNDAYIPFLGENKHPRLLAASGHECWGEIWPTIGPMLESVRASGRATWSEDILLFFGRHLPQEEVYVTFTFAPIISDDGQRVDGIFCPCTETTEKVVGARRLETLRRLGVRAAEARTVETACGQAAAVLRENSCDIPLAAIYVLDAAGQTAVMTAAVLPDGQHGLPSSVSIGDSASAIWPIATVVRTRQQQEVDIHPSFQMVGRAWPDPVVKGLVLPIPATARERIAGVLVVGIGPRRVLDTAYRTFFDLVASHIGAALADASAYEEERQRAEGLAELDRGKTVFFSNVSHEFRTPLTLMLGPLEDVLGGKAELAIEQRQQITLAHRNGLRLLQLVNSLLDFSRIQAGRVEAAYEPTDIAAFTAELASSFRSAMEKAGLEFAIDCQALPEHAFVDRDMWEKIVLNLISNAFKFTFQGNVSISLKSVGDSIQLQVSDTGTGIAERELPHLFKRFHRVEGARGRTYEGTGIGLALVQELVKLHGGWVDVRSSDGKGSTFTVSIPKGKGHLPADRIRASRRHLSSAIAVDSYVEEALRWLPNSARDERTLADIQADPTAYTVSHLADPASPAILQELIVLADDNSDMRDYISRLLGAQYRVHAVANGNEAVKAARELNADLVLTDVMMPELDGFAVLRAIRSDPATRLKPVILLSARAEEHSRVEALDAGVDDYLVKPFTARELLARVGAHLKMARIRSDAADVERRLRAEVEMEGKRLRDSFAQAPAPITLLRGPNHKFVFANDAYLALVGRKREELLGKRFLDAFPEIRRQGYNEILDKIYLTGETWVGTESKVDLKRSGKDETLYLDFTYLPMRNAAGKIEGILFQGVDVTEKVLARSRLEERVKARTAELEQAERNLRDLNHALLQAHDEERRRLGRELHDGAGQLLVALKWKLASLQEQITHQHPEDTKLANDSVGLLDELSQELRTVSHLLHPPLLEEAGLHSALHSYVDGLAERSGLNVDLQIDPKLQRLSQQMENAVFRIVQEALTNIHRHAKTKAAAVRIEQYSDDIRVIIQDKGRGVSPSAGLPQPDIKPGVGILGMRERVRQLKGQLDISSGTAGTTVTAVFPRTERLNIHAALHQK